MCENVVVIKLYFVYLITAINQVDCIKGESFCYSIITLKVQNTVCSITTIDFWCYFFLGKVGFVLPFFQYTRSKATYNS